MAVPYLNTGRLRALAASIEPLFRASTSPSYLHHSLRVANYAARIAAEESLDREELIAAALVHDIGMVVDPTFQGHPHQTANLAPTLLEAAGFPAGRSRVIKCVAIAHHPPPGRKLTDPSERALYDADFLEIVGVFGLLRWFGGIPADIREMASSAQLFIDIVEAGRVARPGFFYTRLGRALGERPMLECARLCRSLVDFSAQSESGSLLLHPVSFIDTLSNTPDDTGTGS